MNLMPLVTTKSNIQAAFNKDGMSSLPVATTVHIRWNTKNSGDASVAWRVIFHLQTGEFEVNVRNISIQPGFTNNVPKTVTSIVDDDLKGNVEVQVTAINFSLATRELVLFY
jgi:hypothetical protein